MHGNVLFLRLLNLYLIVEIDFGSYSYNQYDDFPSVHGYPMHKYLCVCGLLVKQIGLVVLLRSD